ncbi:MAG: glycosyltransferase family 2 protein [Candidatus Woesearchaeota archaeon]
MGNKVFIVIAAFNEEHSVPKVIKGLRRAGYNNIVVVDDGSKDRTFEAALDAGATVLRHVVNRGQGAALQTGIDYALQEGADIIVTFDADGQHRVEDIPAMVKPVADGEVDITFGSRFLKKESQKNVPFLRKLYLKIGILVLLLFYGVRMTDAHNGFRALSRDAAKKIRITADRMAHASEIVEEVHRLNLKYREVPVIIRYTEETLKKGHGSFREGCRILYTMFVKKFLLR